MRGEGVDVGSGEGLGVGCFFGDVVDVDEVVVTLGAAVSVLMARTVVVALGGAVDPPSTLTTAYVFARCASWRLRGRALSSGRPHDSGAMERARIRYFELKSIGVLFNGSRKARVVFFERNSAGVCREIPSWPYFVQWWWQVSNREVGERGWGWSVRPGKRVPTSIHFLHHPHHKSVH